MKNIYFYVGTTAEFIKLAPVIKRLKEKGIGFKLIHSGQVNVDFREFYDYLGEIKPDISFKSKGKSSSVIKFIFWTVRTLLRSLLVLGREFKGKNKKKTYVIVHGDTVSSLIGAVVSKIYGVKIVHIESGLRSFNFLEPFPEEICRYIISRIADVHFCPNNWAVDNLRNHKGKKINTEENTLIEYFNYTLKRINKKERKIKDKYFVLVVHRQEHVILGKEKTKALLKKIFQNLDNNLLCVFTIHDISRKFVDSLGLDKRRVVYQKRLPYKDFLELMYHSEFVLTDGGSNQEELYYMGKPTLILRNVTERIEGLGKNVVLSKKKEKVINDFLSNYKKYRRKPLNNNISPSGIIIEYLLSELNRASC